MIWYPRYTGDYLRDTAHLSMTEHGAYCTMLDHYYSIESPLPVDIDSLHRITKAFTDAEREAVASIVGQFFEKQGDGKLHNKKADRVILEQSEKKDRQVNAAKVAANARWNAKGNAKGNTKRNAKGNAKGTPKAMRNGMRLDCHPEPEPDPDPKDKSKDKPKGKSTVEIGGAKPRERNIALDALASCDGDITEIGVSGWKKAATALKAIKAVAPDVTPEEITRRAENYETHFDGAALSSTALAKWWAKCKEERPPIKARKFEDPHKTKLDWDKL